MPVYLRDTLERDIRFIVFGFNQSNSSNMVGKFNKETLYYISNFYLCVKHVFFYLEKITSPPNGTRLTFLPGSTAKLQWTYNCSGFCDPIWLDHFFLGISRCGILQVVMVAKESVLQQ